MNTLWTFGDSFTFGDGCRLDGPGNEYCHNYKKDSDDIWPNIVGNRLNTEVKNFGKCGASNDFIIDCIIDQWDNFKENDFVIIGITFYSRFDVPLKNKMTLSTNYWDYGDLANFDADELEQMKTIVDFQYHFADNKLYKLRHLKRFNFLHKLLRKKKITAFSWEVPTLTESDRFQKIIHATEGKIEDYHFSFKGHLDFAEMIYEQIKNPNLV
jgi:hypothetical protein